VTVVALVLLLAGTAWGQDDHFPFGPFRMFAYATKPTGRVTAARIEAVTSGGDLVRVGAHQVGMRRAELEGLIPTFRRDPELLGVLADTYADLQPDAPPLVEVRLEYRIHRLVDGRVTRQEVETLAVWQR
jgi:hypothetical protein